jgi:hypothetical protein
LKIKRHGAIKIIYCCLRIFCFYFNEFKIVDRNERCFFLQNSHDEQPNHNLLIEMMLKHLYLKKNTEQHRVLTSMNKFYNDVFN